MKMNKCRNKKCQRDLPEDYNINIASIVEINIL